MVSQKRELSPERAEELLEILKVRFTENIFRHKNVKWIEIQNRLKESPGKLWSLNEMEKTGGEPDVAEYDAKSDEYVFYDCSPESPLGRRSVCYDPEALASRKANKPKHSAVGMADEMGIQILTEEQYLYLQTIGNFDSKTSSWISTPAGIRQLGGAIFGDYRFGRVFIYHNGVESYYSGRSFRGMLCV